MKTLNEIKELPNLMIQHIAVDGGLGVLFKAGKSFATVVWSNGGGWEHVSISPIKHSYTPTWDEMCKLKDMFFCSDETVVQYHPAKNEYVNNLPNCLHLWRPINEKMPAPPSIFVGVKHGQSIEEVKAAIKEYDHLARSKDEKI